MKKQFILIAILMLFSAGLSAAGKLTEISGTLSFLRTGDIVQIEINKYPDLPFASHLFETHDISAVKDSFNLKFNCTEPFIYVSIIFKGKAVASLQYYMIPSGGQVNISDIDRHYQFSGRSAKDFDIQRDIREILNNQTDSIKFTPENLERYYTAQDLGVKQVLEVLSASQHQISKCLYNPLKANVIYGVKSGNCFNLRYYGHSSIIDSIHKAFEKPYKSYLEHQKPVWDTIGINNDKDKLHSAFYAKYVFEKYYADSCFITERPFSEHQFLEFINHNFTGELRERLAVYLFLARSNKSQDNLQTDLDHLLGNLINPDFRPILTEIRANNFGSQVRDFVLTDVNNKKVKLSMFRDKVVVLDFYYTGCGNCRLLAPVLHQVEEDFKYKDVVFLSISIDKNRTTWLASVKSQLYSSPLSVNLYTSGKGTDDPMIKGFNISGYPTLLLIDKNGKLGKNSIDPRSDAGKDLKQNISTYLNQ